MRGFFIMKNVNELVAKELYKIAKELVADDYEYIYDPDHKKHPGGGYTKTENGWAKGKKEKESPVNDFKGIQKLVESPKTSPDVLERLVSKSTAYSNGYDPYGYIREKVAGHPNTKPEILDKLSNDGNFQTRAAVAKNPNTFGGTLNKLSNDSNTIVRMSVAENKTVGGDILDKLSNDKEWFVRANVAYNTNAYSETLEKLSNDEEEEVRLGVASNLKTSKKILEKLKNDKDKGIRSKAIQTSTKKREIRKTTAYKAMKKYEIAMNSNEYYEAFRAVANYFGDSNTVKQLNKIEKEHIKAGHLTEELREKRLPIINKLREKMRTEENPKFQEARTVAHVDSINDEFQDDVQDNFHFDITKLSPELREKVKDWDAEDIAKFIGWLKQQKEEGQE